MIEVSISVCLLLTELRLPHQLLQHGLGLGRVTRLQLLGLGRGAAVISVAAVTVPCERGVIRGAELQRLVADPQRGDVGVGGEAAQLQRHHHQRQQHRPHTSHTRILKQGETIKARAVHGKYLRQ